MSVESLPCWSLVYHALSSADSSTTMIRPKHVGPVMCLTSPGDGLFVSGGQDGTLRNGTLSKRQQQLTRRRRTTTMLEMVAVHKSRPSVITHCLGINYGLGVCGPMVSVFYRTVESNRL